MDKNLQSFFAIKMPSLKWPSADAVIKLFAEGATIPFIARYRKEKTGGLDEVVVRDIGDTAEEYKTIVGRKVFIVKEVGEQGNLSDELSGRINACWDLAELEELYRPYKKKKKTKATIAREAGLAPFADWIWNIGHGEDADNVSLEVKAKDFINPAAKFVTYEEVLRGATHILVERVSNNPELRALTKTEYNEKGKLVSKPGKKVKTKSKYETYFAHTEEAKSLLLKKSSHRYLAMRRGWKEGELTVTIEVDEEALLPAFNKFACSNESSIAKGFLGLAAKQALLVHVAPSVTNEMHTNLKKHADLHAIDVFASNIKKVLLSSAFGAKCVLGVDPGLRTGCKVALVDKKGQFISHTVLQMKGDNATENAKKLFEEVMKQIEIEAVAVGNGTGGREAELFLRKILKELGKTIPVVMISESGASIYSASDVAREEFPDIDLTVRGAISIARRLQDPLAELVKIEPKSIGVGQYQHDVSQTTLKKKLDEVVESCVNLVGVDVNTASPLLLQHVAGIGPGLAKNIIKHRAEKGLFTSLEQLNQVERLSSKAFEQSAGFLRINGGDVTLDATGIHPERYSAVKDMAQELSCNISSLIGTGAEKILELRTKWAELVGNYTFEDIYEELKKPGRDPRDPYKAFEFRDDIFEVDDLKVDMICNGIVTNVTNFGAFVDIGVHQDGLVHISEIASKFVDDPQKVVSPGDHVQVKIKAVDKEKKQISLSMKLKDEVSHKPRSKRSADGDKKRVSFKKNQTKGKGAGRGGKRPPNKGQKGGKGRGGQPFNNPFAAALGEFKK